MKKILLYFLFFCLCNTVILFPFAEGEYYDTEKSWRTIGGRDVTDSLLEFLAENVLELEEEFPEEEIGDDKEVCGVTTSSLRGISPIIFFSKDLFNGTLPGRTFFTRNTNIGHTDAQFDLRPFYYLFLFRLKPF